MSEKLDRFGNETRMSHPTKEQRLQVKSLAYRLARYYHCTMGFDWARNYYMSDIDGVRAPEYIAALSFYRVPNGKELNRFGQPTKHPYLFFNLVSVYCYDGKDKYKMWKTFLDEHMNLCQGKTCRHLEFMLGRNAAERMLLNFTSYEELDMKLSVAGL